MTWRWVPADDDDFGGRIVSDWLGIEADLMECNGHCILLWSSTDDERVFAVVEGAEA